MNQPKPVFVIGSYRSGTSVLTWAIGQHPNILPLEETNWIYRSSVDFYNLFDLGSSNDEHSHLPSIGWTQQKFMEFFGASINSLILSSIDDYLVKSIELALNNLPPNEKEAIPVQSADKLALYHKLAPENFSIKRSNDDPKQRWVDGTPENSHYVYGLSLLFPEAKFIHILRNPKKVAKSLMNFSTMGQYDYPEEQAYMTWKRLVSDCVLAERALGKEKVLRIYQEDLENDPEKTMRTCLGFLGEAFTEDCLLPLNVRINSSTYDKDFDTSIESNLNSVKTYEKDCFQFYKQILDEYPDQITADPMAYEQMKHKFIEYCISQRPSEIDKVIAQKDRMIEQLEKRIQLQNLPVVIKKFGPEVIFANEPFNLQPDGTNAIWVEGDHITFDCVICLNDEILESSVENENLITAKVPSHWTSQKGILKLQVMDRKTGTKSNIIAVEIH